MKKTIKALKFSLVLSLIVTFFLACDKDFSVIESNVLGEDNVNFNTDTLSFQIAAYNKKLEALQINGLSSSLLGVYNDPAYGQTVASIVTQVIPTTYPTTFGTNVVIDSVVLTIPYFSRVTGTDANGNPTYTILDSLYGKKPDAAIKPFKLTVYQNNYFLRDFDPSGSLGESQKFYSKADGSINMTDNFALNGTSTINFDEHKGAVVYSRDTITPSSKAIKTTTDQGTETAVTTRSIPALRDKLDTAFWKAAILDQEGLSVISNASNFNNYFRGLYFKAEAVDGDGNMILLNIASTNANITIHYSKDSTVENERTQDSYILRFTGNKLNTFINNYNTAYKTAIETVNTTAGDEKLYLKGAEGSMAVVDLFSGTVDHEGENISALQYFLDTYRIPLGNGVYKTDVFGNYILKRLINDAQLIVYEDESMPTNGVDENDNAYHKFDRIYAYDLENNKQLIDYDYDPTLSSSDPYNSAFFHLGQRKTNDGGISKYKIHLTEHLNNILLRDSTNTKIGLVLSTNVNLVNSAKILNGTGDVTSVPSPSLLTPRGTILYGTNTTVPNNRKMKLKIFFTEPK
ncbi:DUF4270 domain-containing protein [Mariniflexile sp. AS56]|uniref:DUF4270 domain-containing protein n=1 Tax=Mariniflexile sp. AS56 TaxID=3063957 RepID=UPI0026EF9BF6|nr:DUF4270 domain-containing protein [Mariniflexile sp. AS56]MDO7171071.1 DUF4270 domain-containing protein [Mariniflexile sp. AS56]